MRQQLRAEVGGRVAIGLLGPGHLVLGRGLLGSPLDELPAQDGVGLPLGPVRTPAQHLHQVGGETGGQNRVLEATNGRMQMSTVYIDVVLGYLCSLESMLERTCVAATLTAATLSWTSCVAMGARYSRTWAAVYSDMDSSPPSCSVSSSRNLSNKYIVMNVLVLHGHHKYF